MRTINMRTKTLSASAPFRDNYFTQRSARPCRSDGHKGAKKISNAFLFFLAAFILFVNILPSNAQEISAEASAKVKDYLVGDRILVTLIVKRPENFSVKWIKQDPDPAKLELVDSIAKDSAKQNGFMKIDYLLPLAGFDSGTAVYPAQLFVFHKKGDTASFILKTKPITFHVSSITVDLKKDIKPIVDPMDPGLDWRIIGLYVLAGLIIVALLLVGYLLWKRYSRRRKEQVYEPQEIKRPSWEIAIENLTQLQKDDLPSKGEVKEYYSGLSNIMRQYVSEQFDIDALDLTTQELAEILKRKPLKADAGQILFHILELSDSVKFAKYKPDESDHIKAMSEAYEFVSLLRGH